MLALILGKLSFLHELPLDSAPTISLGSFSRVMVSRRDGSDFGEIREEEKKERGKLHERESLFQSHSGVDIDTWG